VLPDRFDRDGRQIDRGKGGGEQEMVERLVHGFGDVIDGRQSWKALLKGFWDESGGLGGGDRGEGRSR